LNDKERNKKKRKNVFEEEKREKFSNFLVIVFLIHILFPPHLMLDVYQATKSDFTIFRGGKRKKINISPGTLELSLM
jgi:hypothetical protein